MLNMYIHANCFAVHTVLRTYLPHATAYIHGGECLRAVVKGSKTIQPKKGSIARAI